MQGQLSGLSAWSICNAGAKRPARAKHEGPALVYTESSTRTSEHRVKFFVSAVVLALLPVSRPRLGDDGELHRFPDDDVNPRAGLLSGERELSHFVERPAIVTACGTGDGPWANLSVFLDGQNDPVDGDGLRVEGFTRDPKSGAARVTSASYRADGAVAQRGLASAPTYRLVVDSQAHKLGSIDEQRKIIDGK